MWASLLFTVLLQTSQCWPLRKVSELLLLRGPGLRRFRVSKGEGERDREGSRGKEGARERERGISEFTPRESPLNNLASAQPGVGER